MLYLLEIPDIFIGGKGHGAISRYTPPEKLQLTCES
jgi:hypothetical protein